MNIKCTISHSNYSSTFCRETILKTAKSLVEDTKVLVAGAASTQDDLATAAQSAMMTIIKLADCVKNGALSLGAEQPEAQVLQRKQASYSNQIKDFVHNVLYLIERPS